jgi:hypothetical protein
MQVLAKRRPVISLREEPKSSWPAEIWILHKEQEVSSTLFYVLWNAAVNKAIRRYFRLPPRPKLDLRSSGMLRSVYGYLVTDVLEQPISSIFKG